MHSAVFQFQLILELLAACALCLYGSAVKTALFVCVVLKLV